MATIYLRLSSKKDKVTSQSEILMRFKHGDIAQRAKTNIFVSSENWSDEEQSIIIPKWRVLTDEKKQLIDELQDKQSKLNDIKEHVDKSFKNADKKSVKENNKWLTDLIHDYNFPTEPEPKEENNQPEPQTLMQALDSLIESAEKGTRTVGKNQKPVDQRTTTQYRQVKKLLQRYFSTKNIKKNDIDIIDVNKKFYEGFTAFLYEQGYKLNTVGKHVKNIKVAINALSLDYKCEFLEPKKCVKLSEDIDNIYLTEDELSNIASLEIATPYLDKVRDQFLLLAWTGCRYSDLPKLRREYIYKMSNGGSCFKFEQKKTGTKVVIPIFPQVQYILDKYNYEIPKPMSNQPFNRFLKDVAKLAGLHDVVTITHTQSVNGKIKKVEERYEKWECVTAHTARRSFATNMYKRKYPTLMIMKITGHKTEKSFLSYIKVSEEENAELMLEKFKIE